MIDIVIMVKEKTNKEQVIFRCVLSRICHLSERKPFLKHFLLKIISNMKYILENIYHVETFHEGKHFKSKKNKNIKYFR